MPVVAKERDIEPPRGLKVDRLRQPKAVALALQRPGRNPQASVVGIADVVVGQPARQLPPFKLPVDFSVAQREPGVDAVVLGKGIAQPKMGTQALFAHKPAKAARKAVVEPKHAPIRVEPLPEVKARQRHVQAVEKAGSAGGNVREYKVVLIVAQHIAQRHLDAARGAKFRVPARSGPGLCRSSSCARRAGWRPRSGRAGSPATTARPAPPSTRW